MTHTQVAIRLMAMIGWTVVGNGQQPLPEPTSTPVPLVEALTEHDRINIEANLRWLLQRERDRGARILQADGKQIPNERVGVFADAGVWHIGAKSIVDVLEEQQVPCRVLDRSLLTTERLSGLEVLVLPGGWAPLQWSTAGAKGLAAIQTFVENGGRCVAICAGAYLLSKATRYEGKEFPYPLGLFDGVAEGLAPFPKPGSTRLKVTTQGLKRGLAALETGDVYYSGGPCFKEGTQIVVLARYPDDSPAMIYRKFGKGEVLLMGVHLERPVPMLGDEMSPPPPLAHSLLRTILFP